MVSVFYKENSQKVQVHSRPTVRRFSRTPTLTGFRSLEHPKALKHLLAILPHHTYLIPSSCWPGTHCPSFSFFFRRKLPVLNPGLWRPTPSLLWHLGQPGTLFSGETVCAHLSPCTWHSSDWLSKTFLPRNSAVGPKIINICYFYVILRQAHFDIGIMVTCYWWGNVEWFA